MNKEQKSIVKFGVLCIVICEVVQFVLSLLFPRALDAPEIEKSIQENHSKVIEVIDEDKTCTNQQIRLDFDEFSWLCAVVYAEAGAEPVDIQTQVAEVILRRIKSPEFPNSLQAVLMEPGAFDVVMKNGDVIMGKGESARQIVFSDVPKSTVGAVANACSGSNYTEENILFFAEDPRTGATVFSDKPML